MSIRVACPCGQRFTAKPELSGKVVKCPKCGGRFRVPAPKTEAPEDPLGNLFDLTDLESGVASPTVSGRICPTCHARLADNAVICISCGTDLRSGRKLSTLSQQQTRLNNCTLSVTQDSNGHKLIEVKGIFLSRKYDPKEYQTVCFVQQPRKGYAKSVVIAIMILLCMCGFVPGLLFWWMLFNSDDVVINYSVELRTAKKRETIYQCGEDDRREAEAAAKMIAEATGLIFEQDLQMLD